MDRIACRVVVEFYNAAWIALEQEKLSVEQEKSSSPKKEFIEAALEST